MKYKLLMNNIAVSPYKNTFLLAILLITIIASISPLNSFAREEEKKERGWQGSLCDDKDSCYDELRKELKNVQNDVSNHIEGYIIKGSDIIKIIEKTDLNINIYNSVIEGGLDFTKLPVVDQKIKVNNRISIANSEIGFWEEESYWKEGNIKISVDSRNILFNKPIFFYEAQFSGRADFSEAQFSGRVNFWKAQFSGVAYFRETKFNEEALFGGALFNEGAYFFETQFSEVAYFRETKFNEEAYFRNATFHKLAFFQGAIFYNELILDGVLFQEYADFRNTVIRRLNWNNTSPTIIRGRIDLREARITKSHFENLVFENDVDFSDVEFGIGTLTQYDFLNFITFIEDLKIQADLNSENPGRRIWDYLFSTLVCTDLYTDDLSYLFDSLLNRDKNTFSVDFSYSQLQQMNACIDMGANLDEFEKGFIKDLNSILKSRDFYNKEYFSESNLGDTVNKLLEKGINNLSDTEILQLNLLLLISVFPGHIAVPTTLFRFITFESDTRFIRTKFFGDIGFEDVNFEKGVNFKSADFKLMLDWDPKFSLSYINFNDLIIEFKQLPEKKNWVLHSKDKIFSFVDRDENNNITKELQPLSEVYAGLEATFRGNNMLSDRNLAYFNMKQAELSEIRRDNSLFTWKRIETEAGWLFWGLPTGYGTKIWRIVIWSLGFFAIFSVVYWRWGKFHRFEKDEGSQFRLRLIVFPWQYYTRKSVNMIDSTSKIVHAIRFSMELILKLGYRNTTISGGGFVKSLVVFEWILGYYLLAVLVITLKNTVPIINSLIAGVF